jgi:hypothetical protein
MNFISNRWLLSASSVSVAALLAACGGGSSTPPPVAQASLMAVATPATFLTTGNSTLSTSGGSGTGAVSFAVTSGACTITGSTLTATAAGSCTVTAKKAADASYLEATSGAITVTVTAPYSGVTVVQNQTATQDSYVAGDAPSPAKAGTSLPGNNTTGSYAWNQGGNDWWAGVGTDSVYKGIGAPAKADAGVGVFVKGAGTTTWGIDGATSMTVGLGTNPECVGICKATIVLLTATTDCKATIKAPITILTTAVNTGLGATPVNGAVPVYTATLADANWTVSGCTTNTMTAFKSLRITEVHAQLLQANMQSTVPLGGPYPNGINLGAVKFQ